MAATVAPKTVLVEIAWLGALVAALVASLAESLPFRLAFIRPSLLHAALLQVQVFFMLLVWPLLLPLIDEGGSAPRTRTILLRLGGLLALSLPLVLLAGDVSGSPPGRIVLGQGLVAACAVVSATLVSIARDRRAALGPAYFLLVFMAGAAAPFLHFLLRELGRGSGAGFLAPVSPFWSVSSEAPVPVLLVFGLTGVALVALRGFLRKPVDAPPGAR
jgi:hypothetical protein